MSVVVAVADAGDEAVVRLAEGLGARLGDRVGTRRLPAPPPRVGELLDELADDADVEVVVLRFPAGTPSSWDVVARSDLPLVVLPTGCGERAAALTDVLLPVDGTRRTSQSVAEMVGRLLVAGARVRAVHVFDQSTVPAFWDQAAHSVDSFTEEFKERHLPEGVELDLRSGRPPDEVLAEAERQQVDLIVVGWSQNVSEGRAALVKEALLHGTVPVLLLPTPAGPSVPVEGPSALEAEGDQAAR